MSVTIRAGITASERAAVEEMLWQDNMRARYAEEADALIARAGELSLTTPMRRGDARWQAERELLERRFRAFSASPDASPVESEGQNDAP